MVNEKTTYLIYQDLSKRRREVEVLSDRSSIAFFLRCSFFFFFLRVSDFFWKKIA